jgi:hypothetical protein
VHDHGDLALTAEQLGHVLGGLRGGGLVVGGGGGDRDVALDPGVEGDDGDVGALGLLQQGGGGPAVERREADGVGLAGQGVGQHLDLDLDVGLGGRALEGDGRALLLGRLLGTGLDGLPELVLEALGHDGDHGAVLAASAATAGAGARSCGVTAV